MRSGLIPLRLIKDEQEKTDLVDLLILHKENTGGQFPLFAEGWNKSVVKGGTTLRVGIQGAKVRVPLGSRVTSGPRAGPDFVRGLTLPGGGGLHSASRQQHNIRRVNEAPSGTGGDGGWWGGGVPDLVRGVSPTW